MNFLAISTSESNASLALSWGECEDQLEFDKKGSPSGDFLIQKIGELLEKHQVPREKIDSIGVNIGPGSFTGTRVGVATANALGLGLRVPVTGFSSLDLIAYEWLEKNKNYEGKIVTALDAGRKQYFAAIYSLREGVFEKSGPDALWDMDGFNKASLDLPLAGWKLEACGLSFEALCPSALSALRLLKKMPRASFPSYAIPNYVRATDAENNLIRSKNI